MGIETSVMENRVFIENFNENKKIDEIFYVEEKHLRVSSKGKEYLDLTLRDRTGTVNAKIWDKIPHFNERFEKGDFIRVNGLIEIFNRAFQLKILSLDPVSEENVDLSNFINAENPAKVEFYFDKIVEFIDSAEDPDIKTLLESFFNDPEFVRQYKRCPAAKMLHHDHLGGLVKHTYYMLVVAKYLKNIYKHINFDLLMAGILFHDMGKIYELEATHTISYTHEGELIGHAVLGIEMIQEKIRELPGFPSKKAMLIKHMLLSHHGQLEFGAVKYPSFPEAMLLHLIDTIDSKMEIMSKELDKIDSEGLWTERIWALNNNRIMKLENFLDRNP
ncbi:MAG: 3'-5' exoribonuclease YhaM family protein [Vulcanimicrobiota bacterium]